MKAKRGQPKSPGLHLADPAVEKAEAMPPEKRRRGRNKHSHKDTGNRYVRSLLAHKDTSSSSISTVRDSPSLRTERTLNDSLVR